MQESDFLFKKLISKIRQKMIILLKKNMVTYRFFSVLVGIVLLATGCKKDKTCPDEVIPSGKVALEISHLWNQNGVEVPFLLETDYIQSNTEDTLQLTVFKYYISNVKLKKTDGTWWNHPESYFLVDAGNLSELILNDVPVGSYSAISYTLGVDSLRNVSGAQTGALSTTNGMFWSWNSGYIFIKAEGISPNIPQAPNAFAFHLSGFSGEHTIVTERTFELENEYLEVSMNKQSKAVFTSRISSLWNSAQSVSISSNIQSTGAKSKAMAIDFYSSFAFESVEN